MKRQGFLYFLLNSSYPGLVKIGHTHRTLAARISELRSTGVPSQFIVAASFWVYEPKEVEGAIHHQLRTKRLEADREFFTITVAAALAECLHLILPSVCDSGAESQPPCDPHVELTKPQIWLLEFALGDNSPNTLVDRVAHEYDLQREVVMLHADHLVDMNLLMRTRNGFQLSPKGRSLCFEDDRIWSNHVTEP